ncbi:hypothetical protein [Thermoflavimicrobium daqui]|uniref:Uncharacterized protein n=1 Tax=Thermoflavimicrobium daqui TaxID=2137476 RepID=A0A364K1X0_9BACL|nr:hypothetical protein [Thermoflavimicrobium daqui]RAL21955.1 hypothetical protein DL897_15325 [Thermoflavimicrobium daqui]
MEIFSDVALHSSNRSRTPYGFLQSYILSQKIKKVFHGIMEWLTLNAVGLAGLVLTLVGVIFTGVQTFKKKKPSTKKFRLKEHITKPDGTEIKREIEYEEGE